MKAGLSPRCPARKVIAERKGLLVSLDFFENFSQRGLVLSGDPRLLLGIHHDLTGARFSNPLSREGLHRGDRAKGLLLFRFCHVLRSVT